MQVKIIPIGQILMLALLIFLIGIGITAIMKKADASSKARKTVFWSSITIGAVVALIGVLGINGLFNHRMPYTWILYPLQIAIVTKLAIFFGEEIGIMAVIAVVFVILARLTPLVIEKLSKIVFKIVFKIVSKISRWYNKLTK